MVLKRLKKMAATAALAITAASAGNFGALESSTPPALLTGYTVHSAPAAKVEVLCLKPGQSLASFARSTKGKYAWAVNANYFEERTRTPIGFLIDNGKRVKSLSPKASRTAVGIFKDNGRARVLVGRMLHTASGKLYAHGNINWLDAFEAVQGGPKLVEDGKVIVGTTGYNEGFNTEFFKRLTRRTVAGIDRNGNLKVLVFHADVSLKRAAQVAKNNGLQQAVNLDGSKSTVLIKGGKLVLHTKGVRPPVFLAARK